MCLRKAERRAAPHWVLRWITPAAAGRLQATRRGCEVGNAFQGHTHTKGPEPECWGTTAHRDLLGVPSALSQTPFTDSDLLPWPLEAAKPKREPFWRHGVCAEYQRNCSISMKRGTKLQKYRLFIGIKNRSNATSSNDEFAARPSLLHVVPICPRWIVCSSGWRLSRSPLPQCLNTQRSLMSPAFNPTLGSCNTFASPGEQQGP